MLSAKPFSIKSSEAVQFFLAKPEEMNQQQMQKRAPVLILSQKLELRDFNDAIGLLTYMRYYQGAAKLAEMIRQKELQKDDLTYTICLLNTFGVNDAQKDAEWDLYKELELLKLDEV